jgi:hypothetical protein
LSPLVLPSANLHRPLYALNHHRPSRRLRFKPPPSIDRNCSSLRSPLPRQLDPPSGFIRAVVGNGSGLPTSLSNLSATLLPTPPPLPPPAKTPHTWARAWRPTTTAPPPPPVAFGLAIPLSSTSLCPPGLQPPGPEAPRGAIARLCRLWRRQRCTRRPRRQRHSSSGRRRHRRCGRRWWGGSVSLFRFCFRSFGARRPAPSSFLCHLFSIMINYVFLGSGSEKCP